MKKIKFLSVFLISIFAFNIKALAASGSLSVSSGSVYVGDRFTVTANVISVASWNVHVSASGPVSGCLINQANATDDAQDTNNSFSATCTATGVGTITVTLSGDVTSASDGNAVGISGSRSVIVSTRPDPTPTPTPTPAPTPSAGNNADNKTEEKSRNNNLKELSVEGYEIVKVDDHYYTLSVSNDVTSINVKATAEDSKATVNGAGKHDINVGENNIDVIVTSESGEENKYIIKVTRKDGYYLEDLDSILKNDSITDINITIGADTKISAQDLEKIKNSGKTVKFNYYNEEKKLVYSWIIDGSKLDVVSDLLTTILYESDYKDDILKLANHADGLFANLKQSEKFPAGAKVRLFVGSKFKDGDFVNVYSYSTDTNNIDLIVRSMKVENGYIEFDVTNYADYFVTEEIVSDAKQLIVPNKKSSSNIMPLFLGTFAFLAIILLFIFISKRKKSKKVSEQPAESIIDDPLSQSDTPSTFDQPTLSTIEDVNSLDSSAVNEAPVSNIASEQVISQSPISNINANQGAVFGGTVEQPVVSEQNVNPAPVSSVAPEVESLDVNGGINTPNVVASTVSDQTPVFSEQPASDSSVSVEQPNTVFYQNPADFNTGINSSPQNSANVTSNVNSGATSSEQNSGIDVL